MSKDKQLARKIAALTGDTVVEDGAMRLGQGGNASAVALILEAIDNTVLPRHLTFVVDGASATLAVAGRRLRSLVSTTGPLKAKKKLVGQLLSRDDTDDIKELGAMLGRLVTRSGAILLRREDVAGQGGQSDTGVGLATLSQVWEVDPFAEPLPKLEQFLKSVQDVQIAFARIEDGKLKDAEGDTKMVSAMRAKYKKILSPMRDEHAALRKENAAARCITLGDILPDGALLSFLDVDNESLIVATVEDSWNQISLAWSGG